MKKVVLQTILIILTFNLIAQVNDVHSSFKSTIESCNTNRMQTQHKFVESTGFNQWDLTYQQLQFQVNPKDHYISGAVSFHFTALENSLNELQIDIHENLQIDSITYHDSYLSFNRPDSLHAIVKLQKTLNTNQKDSFTIHYQGAPITAGFGSFTTSFHDNSPILSTLSEPYGARDWWPCKQSLVDKIDSIDIIVTSPEAYRTASNGVLVSDRINNNNRVCHWKHRHPIASYLVAIAVTNYATYSETATLKDGTEVEILNYVYPETLTKSQSQTIVTKDYLEYFSEIVIPYPFANEKYGHAQFNWGGGMEHQTMSFMGGFSNGLIAHELAHQWFGDYITCGSWSEIWLNEGFATYLTGLVYEKFNPDYFKLWLQHLNKVVTSKPDGSVYVLDTTSVSRIFSSRLSYYKAALVLHMLRGQIGDENFFEGIRNYATDSRVINGFATTDLLFENFEMAADTSLAQFKQQWVYTEGFPIYDINWSRKNNEILIHVEQSNSMDYRMLYEMKIPITIWSNGIGEEIWLENNQSTQEYNIPFSSTVDSISMDYNHWILKDLLLEYASKPYWDTSNVQVIYSNNLRRIEIRNPENLNQVLTIYDLNGQIISRINFDSQRKTLETNFPEGFYFVNLKSSKNNLVERILIQ